MKTTLTMDEFNAQVIQGSDTDGDEKAGFNKDGGMWMLTEVLQK